MGVGGRRQQVGSGASASERVQPVSEADPSVCSKFSSFWSEAEQCSLLLSERQHKWVVKEVGVVK